MLARWRTIRRRLSESRFRADTVACNLCHKYVLYTGQVIYKTTDESICNAAISEMTKMAANDGGAVELKSVWWLLCRAGGRLCALPVDCVVEITRLLPIEPLPAMPGFVRGLSIIRGAPVPIIDGGALVGEPETGFARLVNVIAGDRPIGIAVQEVLGVRALDAGSLSALPPLLQDAAADVIERIRVLDGALLLVLDTARLVPQSVLEDIAAGEAGS
jgi:purine-binding chemotaxis protein CheW